MEHFKNYFKSSKEIFDFFGSEFFKFSFMCDGIVFFKSLQKRIINDCLYDFELSFYFEHDNEFSCYSGFNDYLESMKIHKIDIIYNLDDNIVTNLDNNRETMYFKNHHEYVN